MHTKARTDMHESTPARPDDGRGDAPDLNVLWDATCRQEADTAAATIERMTSDFRVVIQKAKAQLHDLEQMTEMMAKAVGEVAGNDPRDSAPDAMHTVASAML